MLRFPALLELLSQGAQQYCPLVAANCAAQGVNGNEEGEERQ